MKKPKVSIIILTYNRAGMVERSIKSVLRQSFKDYEIVLVDNGSTDATAAILKKYKILEKIRIYTLKENIGYPAGMNYAFDRIRGDWFCQLGDDDIIYPDALAALFNVIEEIDANINMVTCNGIDSETKQLIGQGLNRDQRLTVKEIVGKMSGNWWGITKTVLINGHRFNENLRWTVDVFWLRIHALANHYYLHKPLLEWNTNHLQTETVRLRDACFDDNCRKYEELVKEENYWNILSIYNPKACYEGCLRGMLFMVMGNKMPEAFHYMEKIVRLRPGALKKIMLWIIIHANPGLLKRVYLIFKALFKHLYTFKVKVAAKPRKGTEVQMRFENQPSLEASNKTIGL